ncbi:MAG: CHASE2 domain-containing protein [Salibacteraceae bacterium]
MKHIFNWDSLFCSLYIAGLIWLFTVLPLPQTDLFDPLAKAFDEVELSDMAFASPAVDKFGVDRGGGELEEHFIRKKQSADTNIVLVNIQHLNRAQIAQQIENLNKHSPKVIAIDAFFRKDKDPMQDFPLEMAFSQVKNLVLVAELEKGNGECFDSLSTSNPKFNQYAQNGFANVNSATKGTGFRTVKEVYPYGCLKDTVFPNFTTKIVELFDPEAYKKLNERSYDSEVINWRGHYDKFYALDWDDVLHEKYDLSFVKDKIILMGYIGMELGQRDLEDIFFTPQNHKIAGRSYPDTYGVVVHANTISMMLHDNYIYQMPDWLRNLLIIVITYLNVSVFLYVAKTRKIYYDLITKTFQLIEVGIFMYLIIYFMLEHKIKVHLTLLFAAILLSGDLTELYAGSLKPIVLKYLSKFGLITGDFEED